MAQKLQVVTHVLLVFCAVESCSSCSTDLEITLHRPRWSRLFLFPVSVGALEPDLSHADVWQMPCQVYRFLNNANVSFDRRVIAVSPRHDLSHAFCCILAGVSAVTECCHSAFSRKNKIQFLLFFFFCCNHYQCPFCLCFSYRAISQKVFF